MSSRVRIVSNDEPVHTVSSAELAGDWCSALGKNNWDELIKPKLSNVLSGVLVNYGEFARIAYDSFDEELYHRGDPLRGCKYETSELLQKSLGGRAKDSGYRILKYLYANTSNSKLHQSVWIGYVAVCDDEERVKVTGRREILVVWRGTQTSQELRKDLYDLLVPIPWNTECKAEAGFVQIYATKDRAEVSARDDLRSAIFGCLWMLKKQGSEPISITFVGHSLGAALATLSAFDVSDLVQDLYSDSVHICVFGFASPRVGNRAFAKRIKAAGVKVLRIVNRRDLVTKVPGLFTNESSWCSCGFVNRWFPWAYSHCGVLLKLRMPTRNLTFNPFKRVRNYFHYHSLDLYVELLRDSQNIPST